MKQYFKCQSFASFNLCWFRCESMLWPSKEGKSLRPSWKFYFDITTHNLWLDWIQFWVSECYGPITNGRFRVWWIPWHQNLGRFPWEFPKRDKIRGLDEKFQNASTSSINLYHTCILESHGGTREHFYFRIYNARLWIRLRYFFGKDMVSKKLDILEVKSMLSDFWNIDWKEKNFSKINLFK